MQVIIIAAGYATRLKEVSKNRPKQLLPITKSKLMLDYIMDSLEDLKSVLPEMRTPLMVVNDTFHEQFVAWKDEKNVPISLLNNGVISPELKKGALGDIKFALDNIEEDADTLIMGGDNLFDFSLATLYEHFLQCGSSIAVRDLKDPKALSKKFGVVVADEETKKVLDFEEKPLEPKSSLASTLIYMISKDDMAKVRAFLTEQNLAKLDNAGELVRHLVEQRLIHAFPFDETWIDIGSPEELESARDLYSKREESESFENELKVEE